jgi:dihydropyrimidinase
VHQDGESLQQTVDRTHGTWKGVSYCDFAYHLMLFGRLPDTVVEQIPEAVDAGHASVKVFTTDVTPSRRGRKMDFGSIWATFKALAGAGGIAAVHAEDDDIVMYNYDQYIAAGKTSFEHVSQVHSSLAEDLSFRRVIRLAEHVEGAALYMMHVSAASGVDAIAEARSKGLPVYGETLHQYALYNDEDYKRVNGQIYHTYPSLKSEADRQALWRGMESGAIGAVGTDAICTPLDVKVMGKRIDDLTGGSAGVEPRIGVVYSEAVSRRGYSLEHFVDLVSTNAARYLGLYPQKGVIAPGSDADIAILQTGLQQRLRVEDLHETDYSPWAGTEITAWPVTTILRGQVVVDDGRFLQDAAEGQWVHRRVSRPVLEGAG